MGTALAASATLHVVVGLAAFGALRMPEADFELTLPSEVELGLVDEEGDVEADAEGAPSAPETPVEPVPPTLPPEPAASEPSTVNPDGRRDAGPRDAGRPDAGPPDAEPPDAEPPDAGPPDAEPAADAGPGGDDEPTGLTTQEPQTPDVDAATENPTPDMGDGEPGPRVATAEEGADGGARDDDAAVTVATAVAVESGNRGATAVASAAGADGDGGVGRRRSGPGLAAYAPPGAQIALRLDLVRIRNSPYAADVRTVLAGIPDWQLILDGSGIEPLDDLDRVLIASPDLQRAHLVMSGRYRGDEARVRAAVAALAAARGTEAPWRVERGIPVARWANADETERVIALVGPNAFTITRPSDLPRVLAIARARRREARAAARAGETLADDADALLAMQDAEVASLEVDNARLYVRGSMRGVPERLRVSLREAPGASAHVTAEGRFETEAAAEEALAYWERIVAGYRRNALVRLGAAHALDSVTLRRDGTTLVAEADLDPREIRLAVSYLRSLLERPR
jgi:hypothetical protein